jgi:asparagine synthase (glutamine-hydrolysing)
MCGIAGLVYRDPSRPCEAEVITAMRDIAAYRGPDDAGIHLDGPVALGHRRLSIIDLGGGHQPMTEARQALWIVYNGEVYNYRQIREDLIAKGYSFRTQSDTEVILQLYADIGERCVHALNGMFAFAIWDAGRQTLFLARDRMGVKPLYYAETPEAFIFGSEIKSLFASGKIAAHCREEALAEYMLFRQVAGGDTLFRGVKSLPPGCTLTVRDGRTKVSRYWSPRPRVDRPSIAYEEALRQLGELLEDSVKMRLISDVPVGTFCSGGVDSSLVTALAAKLKGDTINTYSVGFDESDFDESAYAQMVSRHCQTTHHELRVGNVEFSELFPKMVWHNDEPLDFANSVHIFALSRLSKEKVTVALTGEGSDELFAGYPRYRIPGLVKSYRHVPSAVRRLAATLTRDHRLAKLHRFASASVQDVLVYNTSYFAPDIVAELCPRLGPVGSGFRRDCLSGTEGLGLDSVGRLSLLDQESFLVSILHRQDKMSMAASIESRVPFMDYRVVEFANRLPTSVKIRNGSGKALVKDLARTLLPAAIVDRKKSGFGVPLKRWFRSKEGLGGRLNTLADGTASDIFDRAVLRRLIAEHRAASHDHSELLWTALNLSTWREAFRC